MKRNKKNKVVDAAEPKNKKGRFAGENVTVTKITAATGGSERKIPAEVNGPKGPEPTRYGDWEQNGRCTDF